MELFFSKAFRNCTYSISSVLVKCMKTEYFSHGGSNFASNFPSRQACQNAIIHVFEEQIYIFLRIDQVLRFFLPNITVLLETISRKMFYFMG